MKLIHCCLLALVPLFLSCGKDWLEEKRDIKLVVPETLPDMRLLLNNADNVFLYDYRGLGEFSADNYYLPPAFYANLDVAQKDGYIWGREAWVNYPSIPEWNESYKQVFYSNVILNGLEKITPTQSEIEEYNDIKGGALYFRARAFLNLVELFALPFDEVTSKTDLGIPLRLAPDINQSTKRSSVKETYDKIVRDLEEAAQLLRLRAIYKTDASKVAAYGLLARCFLGMRDYNRALLYADSCLMIHSSLLDYNSLTLDAPFSLPTPDNNVEVINRSFMAPLHLPFYLGYSYIDSTLFNSYEIDDLRRIVFFKELSPGRYGFRGSYNSAFDQFCGITTDETYLIRAECYARNGKVIEALTDLNSLLEKRWKAGTFKKIAAASPDEVLKRVLIERRKELVMRGLRWSDLRRLNKDPKYAVTLTRSVDGKVYTMPPNDLRYALLIPNYIINISGIQQNSR